MLQVYVESGGSASAPWASCASAVFHVVEIHGFVRVTGERAIVVGKVRSKPFLSSRLGVPGQSGAPKAHISHPFNDLEPSTDFPQADASAPNGANGNELKVL